jgi:hypothetical protein
VKPLLKKLLPAIVLLVPASLFGQINIPSSISGNFQIDAQYYLEDSTIGAPYVPEKMLTNGFGNLNFMRGNFAAGIRYESYQNALLGFNEKYKGAGITYRFASFKVNDLEVTLGNFYDQFGNGLIFRSYEERGLGLDNAMDGIRLRYNPYSGIYLKGFIAQQRFYFDKGPGIVRGFDGEVALSETFKSLADAKTRVTLGGSVVSRYQKDEDPIYNYPENVLAFSGRALINHGGFSLNTEYAFKYNDPSEVNKSFNGEPLYKNGSAFYANLGYTQKGLGVSFSTAYIDNMDYRSARGASSNDLTLNYLPSLSKQQTYRLATLYPNVTVTTGEAGFQGEVYYTFKTSGDRPKSMGTFVSLNYTRVVGIEKDTAGVDPFMGYKSSFYDVTDEVYFDQLHLEVSKKITKNTKLIASYIYTAYNKAVLQGLGDNYGIIYSHIGVVEGQFKLSPDHSIRAELQHLLTEQDKGDWVYGLVEYTISPHWFFAVFDEFNYGNEDKDKQFHYPSVSMGYTKGANRITMGYGKQRDGLLCVGGVCRQVPASNGFSISVTSSF